jgi:ABC-2 type transport system ATP-binding protein
MRLILGLDSPDEGQALVNGSPYRSLRTPLTHLGALLDASALHPGRRARDHLLWLAHSNGIGRRRVHAVLDAAGLSRVAGRRVKGFSLGMAQRLGIAVALLGDPGVLILDEPINGLDTEGIRWIRGLLRGLAAEGRTVLVSSHLMSEMELTADHLIVIGRGQLLADAPMRAFIEGNSRAVTVVRSRDQERLRAALEGIGAGVEPDGGAMRVTGPSAAGVGDVAAEHGIAVHELTPRLSSLEDIYTRMTGESVEYRAGAGS